MGNVLQDVIDSYMRKASAYQEIAEQVEKFAENIKECELSNQNEMRTAIYYAYLIVNNLEDTMKIARGIGLSIESYMGERKITPSDIAVIMDYYDIDDERLQNEARRHRYKKSGVNAKNIISPYEENITLIWHGLDT